MLIPPLVVISGSQLSRLQLIRSANQGTIRVQIPPRSARLAHLESPAPALSCLFSVWLGFDSHLPPHNSLILKSRALIPGSASPGICPEMVRDLVFSLMGGDPLGHNSTDGLDYPDRNFDCNPIQGGVNSLNLKAFDMVYVKSHDAGWNAR